MKPEESNKLDIIIETLARIEERVKAQKETTDKLEKDVESLNRDLNKGKGAIALLGFVSVLVSAKSLFFR